MEWYIFTVTVIRCWYGGVLSILEELYQARTPEIIKSHPMRFLDYISDDVIYPEIKENGLSKCYQILARM